MRAGVSQSNFPESNNQLFICYHTVNDKEKQQIWVITETWFIHFRAVDPYMTNKLQFFAVNQSALMLSNKQHNNQMTYDESMIGGDNHFFLLFWYK